MVGMATIGLVNPAQRVATQSRELAQRLIEACSSCSIGRSGHRAARTPMREPWRYSKCKFHRRGSHRQSRRSIWRACMPAYRRISVMAAAS